MVKLVNEKMRELKYVHQQELKKKDKLQMFWLKIIENKFNIKTKSK